jgi:hypothetical protein
LVWFVQYTDILTFGLIALGIVGGSLIFLQAAAQGLIGIFGYEKARRRRWLIALSVFVLAIVGFNVWGAIHRGDGFFHILYGVVMLALGILLILQAVGYVRTGTWPNATQITFLTIFVFTSAASFGQWLAYSVLETSDFDQDVTLKNDTLTKAKVIVVMSRHTILTRDGVIYVIPDSRYFEVSAQRSDRKANNIYRPPNPPIRQRAVLLLTQRSPNLHILIAERRTMKLSFFVKHARHGYVCNAV